MAKVSRYTSRYTIHGIIEVVVEMTGRVHGGRERERKGRKRRREERERRGEERERERGRELFFTIFIALPIRDTIFGLPSRYTIQA